MTARRLLLALGLVAVAGAGVAAITLRQKAAPPAPEHAEEYECTSCDARAASKARQREALKKAREAAE